MPTLVDLLPRCVKLLRCATGERSPDLGDGGGGDLRCWIDVCALSIDPLVPDRRLAWFSDSVPVVTPNRANSAAWVCS